MRWRTCLCAKRKAFSSSFASVSRTNWIIYPDCNSGVARARLAAGICAKEAQGGRSGKNTGRGCALETHHACDLQTLFVVFAVRLSQRGAEYLKGFRCQRFDSFGELSERDFMPIECNERGARGAPLHFCALHIYPDFTAETVLWRVFE